MNRIRKFRTVRLGLGLVVLHGLSWGVWAAEDLSSFKSPEFIGYDQGRAVVVHDGGVAKLELTREVKDLLGLPDESTEVSPNAAHTEMNRIANQWLVSFKSTMNEWVAQRNSKPVTREEKSDPVVFAPYEEARTAYSSLEFDAEYDPEMHNGKLLTIKGKITKIAEAGENQYKFVIDDFISFEARLSERVTSRDMSGNPKRVGDYEVGQTVSINGMCLGIDADKYITFSNARIL